MNRLFEIREEPLSADEVFAAVRRPDAGAVVVFCGTVRDHSRGQQVTRLDYEAYTSMASSQLAAVGRAIEAEHPGVVLAAVHRVGTVAVGELAVVCAASAAHRAAAFSACSQLIDRLKEQVPIWKREYGPGGAEWVGWGEG